MSSSTFRMANCCLFRTQLTKKKHNMIVEMITSEFGRISLLWAVVAFWMDFKFSLVSVLFFALQIRHFTSLPLSIRQSIITHDEFTITSNSACYLDRKRQIALLFLRAEEIEAVWRGANLYIFVIIFFYRAQLQSFFLALFSLLAKHQQLSAVFLSVRQTLLFFELRYRMISE